ncbi:MAG: hypothetical protein NVSMB17_01770 [Candidatus Dormibacteria bacterium]
MSRGVVLVRSADPGAQLQALRTALSLSLGDRPADLLVAGDGMDALLPPPNSEAQHCLETLRRMALAVDLDADVAGPLAQSIARVVSHAAFVQRLATADFVQVF